MEITKKAKQQLTASPAIIDLQGIVKRFYIGKPNELEILHGIDLQVQEGQFVSIVGESGSGKSTLMNIIGALDQPTDGQYLLDGECVGNLKDKQLSEIRNQKIGFVFQTYNLIPRTSALANDRTSDALCGGAAWGKDTESERVISACWNAGSYVSQTG